MGACQTQSFSDDQLIFQQAHKTQINQFTKEEKRIQKQESMKFLEDKDQKLQENVYDYQKLFNNIRSNILFDDHEFPPCSLSIGDLQNQNDIQWKRVRQLMDPNISTLQKFDSHSIIRGSLNENNIRKNFFQQMLTYMSSYEGVIEQFIIIEKDDQKIEFDQSQSIQQPQSPQLGGRKYNQSHVMSSPKRQIGHDIPIESNKNSMYLRQNGLYGVYLFKEKRRQQIVIDDYIPCNNQGTLFIKTQDNQFWPLILEKALAKLNNSYTDFYNISIQKMVSIFFNSRIMGVQIVDLKQLLYHLELKLGAILRNDNSFMFIYGPRFKGDSYFIEHKNQKYLQINSYGTEVPKQIDLDQNQDIDLKALIEQKKIQKDSLFMNFKEIQERFKMRFLLNMNIMYTLTLNKSHCFQEQIQVETCTFNIKEPAIIQITYKLTKNITSFSLTILKYKSGEDALEDIQINIVRINDINEAKSFVTTEIDQGKLLILIQTIMVNVNDKPDYLLKLKLSDNQAHTESLEFQQSLLDEFQKDNSSVEYTFSKKIKNVDPVIVCRVSNVGLITQLAFKYEQFDVNKDIIEVQFDLIGCDLVEQDKNRIIYFHEQEYIKRGIRKAAKVVVTPRIRLGNDFDCLARKDYNQFYDIFPVFEQLEVTQKNQGINLFINIKQITSNGQWFLYTILETQLKSDHSVKFKDFTIQIPNYQEKIQLKTDEGIILNSNKSYLFKNQLNNKLELSDLQKAKFEFPNLHFDPIQQ